MKKMMFCVLVCAGTLLLGAADLTIENFKTVDPKDWVPFRGGKIVKAPVGAFVTLPGIVTKRIPGSWRSRKDWNGKYNGIAFKVKGCASNDYGCIALCIQAHTFQYYFPLKSQEWVEYRVHFRDLTVYNASGLVLGGKKEGNISIEALERLRFGDRWTIGHNNARRKNVTYQIADIRLISDAKEQWECGKYKVASYDSFRKQLNGGKKLSILCLGDSITAGSAVFMPSVNRYAAQTQKLLREKYGKKQVSVRSLAVAGAILPDVNSWINRDFEEIPDLVTLMIGYNDKSNGYHREGYGGLLEQWIARVAAKTKGKTAILLITPIPGNGPRYYSQDDYAVVVRRIAKKYSLPCLDMNQHFKTLSPAEFASSYADTAHPNAKGQKFFAEKLAAFLMK